jgi:hypothetical protein
MITEDPKSECVLEIEIYSPDKPTPEAEQQIATIGSDMFNMLQTFEHIRTEIDSGNAKKPHILWQLIRDFLGAISTDDPNLVHFEIIRDAMTNLTNDKISIGAIANDLPDHIKKLKTHLKDAPKPIRPYFNTINEIGLEYDKTVSSLTIIELPSELNQLESFFNEKEIFFWDQLFLKYIRKMGPYGKSVAKSIEPLLKENFQCFIKNGDINPCLGFWFNITPTRTKPFYFSEALKILARIIWEEEVKKNERFARYPAGITTKVQPPIIDMLKAENQIEQNDRSIKLYNPNKTTCVGSIEIVMLQPKIIEYILEGVAEFKSLTAIRLIRYFIKKTYEEKINGNGDYRILMFPGGAQEIAKELGLKNKSEPTRIRNLIVSWNHFLFDNTGSLSRLINVGFIKPRSRFSPKEGYEITVLTPLLPYRTFEDQNAFIIPLLQEPPTVGDKKYHARQFILQWKIAELFVANSKDLANNDFIEIDTKTWKDLLYTCGIPEYLLDKIQSSWCGEKGFLIQKDYNFYTLKNEFKALKFLRTQGKTRIARSIAGKNKSSNKKLKKSYLEKCLK